MTSLIEEKIKEFKEKFIEFRDDYLPHFIEYKRDDREENIISAAADALDFLRQALTEVQEAQKRSDIQVLEELKERAKGDWEENNKLAPNAYGTGVEWGSFSALDEAINKIRG